MTRSLESSMLPVAVVLRFPLPPNKPLLLLVPQKRFQLSLLKYPDQHLTGRYRPSGRSLLSLSAKPATALIATLDGTMYLVEKQDTGSMRVIWSFSTGSPIYQSYQAPINVDGSKENASALISGLMECGDDWALYMHDNQFGKKKISESIAEYVSGTPTFSDDGAVTLGSRSITLFKVDAKTGRIIQIHAMSDFGDASAPWNDDRQSVTNILGTKTKDLVDPMKLNSAQLILKIFRTDYSLQSVAPRSGIVLWTTTVAEFEAVLLCQQNEKPSVRASFDAEYEYASDSGLNFAMPYPCQERRKVFRLQKNFLLETSVTERIPGAYFENDMLPIPTSDMMLPWEPNIDRLFNDHHGNMILPTVMPNPLPSLKPKIGFYDSNDNTDALPQPLMEITTPGEVHLHWRNGWSTPLPLILFVVLLLGFSFFYFPVVVKNQVILKDQNSESELKSSPPKKKKACKSGMNNGTFDKKEKHLSSEDEDVLTRKDTDREAWLQFNKVDEGADGQRIGKLFVSNKEIAKGSNGTIVLEGIYEGRAVAVKRLVKAHHDIAYKEIQNLILSDRHPNIVQWHGVEYDQDFVYLALECCTCSLEDLIQAYSDVSKSLMFNKDQAFRCLIKVQMETGKDNMQNLWKANGYPSSLLLKLMRDVVSGIVHLHELGIIHRDLKPQNVLIIKERSLCAKLSDMGISKHIEDMSSLGHDVTGGGSSGWQAPEQLSQGRQTRAVDLFSLGCVLFFCITGGRHPFGGCLERDVNIVKNQKDLFLVEFIPEAKDLISRLLNPDPDLRPKAIDVLHHPFFWSSEMRLSFLRDTSDRVELEDRGTDSYLLKALESIATVTLGGKWVEKMEPAFITDIGRYRRYKFDSVRDLLRVMRNKLNHYRELPQQIQELLGPVPEGFNDYFASRFPRLLIEVYKVIRKYCKEEECFQRYFKNVD